MGTRSHEERLGRILDKLAEVRLLVAGDVILDEYLWGAVDRVSPEAPVPVVHVERESVVLGGAGNVVRNAVALGATCRFATVVGDDADGRHVSQLVKDLGIDPAGVVVDSDRPTTRKTRVVARSQQIVRFDRETDEPLSAPVARRWLEALGAAIDGADAAVLEDYGKGLFGGRTARRALQCLTEAGLFVAVDPKRELSAFRGASLVKPNMREAEALTGIRAREFEDWERIGRKLRRTLGGAELVITRGAAGLMLVDRNGACQAVGTTAQDVFDVQGAGDTTIAVLALALKAGADLRDAAILANAAAGVVVQKSGTATASPDEVRQLLPEAIRAASPDAAGRSSRAGRDRASEEGG